MDVVDRTGSKHWTWGSEALKPGFPSLRVALVSPESPGWIAEMQRQKQLLTRSDILTWFWCKSMEGKFVGGLKQSFWR